MTHSAGRYHIAEAFASHLKWVYDNKVSEFPSFPITSSDSSPLDNLLPVADADVAT